MNGGVGLAEVAGRFRRLALQLRYLAMDIDELVMFCQRRFIAVMIHDAPFSPFQSSLVFNYISLSFVLFSMTAIMPLKVRFSSSGTRRFREAIDFGTGNSSCSNTFDNPFFLFHLHFRCLGQRSCVFLRMGFLGWKGLLVEDELQ